MKPEDIIVGQKYKHKSFPQCHYFGGLCNDEKVMYLITVDGRTMVECEMGDKDPFWDGFYPVENKDPTKQISAIIIFPGEPSVGIHPTYWTIENVGWLDDYEEQREDFREKLTEAFEVLTGGGHYVEFSDERKNNE